MRITAKNSLISAVNEIYNFEDQLNDIALKIYPSPNLKKLITEDLNKVVDEIRKVLISEINTLKQNDQHQINSNVKAINKIWNTGYIQFVANAIAGTDLKSYPLEIMEVFRMMIAKIEGTDFEIITSPTNELNFSFREIWYPLKNALESEVGITTANHKRFVELTFPSQHKDNVFLSGIYAHEIGHYFDRNRGIWSKIFGQKILNHTDLNKLGKYFTKRNNPHAQISDVEIASILHETVMGYWIREAVADCIAVYLLGPAFVFSLNELLTSLVGRQLVNAGIIYDVVSNTHPRHGLRNKFQMEILNNLGLLDNLNEKVKDALLTLERDWGQSTVYYQENIISKNDIQFLLTPDSYKILEDMWSECLPLVIHEVNSLIGDQIIDSTHLDEALRLAEERIKWLVPPNELDDKPSNVKAILNSGWFALILSKEETLSRLQSLNGEKSDYDYIKILNELMKYSLYASSIHERWES
jgi:hypothetical protein